MFLHVWSKMSAGGRRVGAFIANWVGAAGCVTVDSLAELDGSYFQSSNLTIFLAGRVARTGQIVKTYYWSTLV